MICHAAFPSAVIYENPHEYKDVNIRYDVPSSDENDLGLFPPPRPETRNESAASSFSNVSYHHEGKEAKTGHKAQKSRCRRLTETVYKGVRKRAASLKSRSSPPSVLSSRNTSQLNISPIALHRFSTDPSSLCTSSDSSPTSTFTRYSPTTTPASSPQTPPKMATRQSSNMLDPAAAARRRQMSETKTRTHDMAVQEEKAIRARMREKGIEDQFPDYRFVDFIGKGTYGRVYLA